MIHSATPVKTESNGRLALFLLFALLSSSTPLLHAAQNPCPSEVERSQRARQNIYDNKPVRGRDTVSYYLNQLGQNIAKEALPKAPFTWRFIVVRNFEPNAMAVGDGAIMVTDGVITFADNEDEVAAILAHEMGHQIAAHLCRRSSNHGAWWEMQIPSTQQPEIHLVNSITQIIDIDREIEADRAAVEILDKIGYDPSAMLRVVNKLHQKKPSSGHKKRVAALNAALQSYPPALKKRDHNDQAFKKAKEALKAEK